MVQLRAHRVYLRTYLRPSGIRSSSTRASRGSYGLLSGVPQGGIQLSSRSAAPKKYVEIVEHYEACLAKYGDTHLGVDWPKVEDAETRYRVMLEVIRLPRSPVVKLIDFGCGASHLYEHILATGVGGIEYMGLDLSPKFVELSTEEISP